MTYQPILPDDLVNLGFPVNYITADYLGIAYPWDEKTPKQHYSVSIMGISSRFDYYCKTRPVEFSKKNHERIGFNQSEALSFLGCIFGDAELGNMRFKDFCDQLGCDMDSRKAYKTWEACQETQEKLSKVFSDSQQKAILEYLREEGY